MAHDSKPARHPMVGAIFDNEAQVREAFRRLQDAGIPGDSIGLVSREELAQELGFQRQLVDQGDWAGSTVGAGIGGAGGVAAGMGIAGASAFIPVVGPVFAAGALAAILATAGGSLGWLSGHLVGRGVAEPAAKHYERSVEEGALFMTVEASAETLPRVRAILRSTGGREYDPTAPDAKS